MVSLQDIGKKLSPVYSGGELRAVSRVLVEDLLGLRMTDFLVSGGVELSAPMQETLDKAIERLLAGEPVQHVIGYAWFCGNRFFVNSNVLVPRPETAELVEMITRENHGMSLRLLDIGTGSGCIAVSLARQNPEWQVDAWDISPEAVGTALQNATENRVNVDVRCVDLFAAELPQGSYDIIVSNPPYITPSEKADMEKLVLEYEPHLALFVPEDNPLLFYTRIAVKGQEWLTEGGKLYFEINRRFPAETVEMLETLGYRNVEAVKDCNDNFRFVKAVK